MNWHEKLAKDIGSKHSDTIAVVKAGKDAKKRTNRRIRRLTRFELDAKL